MSLVVVVNCGAGNALHGFEKNAIKNVSDTFPESRNVKDYENVKLVNLSSCTAAQLPLILCMISKNSYFGVGRNEKFFTDANFILYSWTQNSIIWTRKLSSNYLHLHQVDIWNVLIWSNLCRKVAPRENPEKQVKSEISLSQLLNIKNIQNLHLDICFGGWQIRWN